MTDAGMGMEDDYAADSGRSGRKLTDIIPIGWLWQQVWGRKLMVLGFALGGLGLGILFAHIGGPSYVGSVQLMPAESDADRGDNLAPVTALFGSDTDAPPSKFRQFSLSLYSVPVAQTLERKYHLICRISPKCDPATGQWMPRTGMRAAISKFARALLGMPEKTTNIPTPAEMTDLVRGKVQENREFGVSSLTMTDRDPALIMTFLSRLIEVDNDYLKDNDRQSLRQYVGYLSNKLVTLDVVAQRESLQDLLTQQSRRLMLTEVNVPYAAAVLGSVKLVNHNPIVGILIFTAVALICGVIIAILAGLFPGVLSFGRGRNTR